MEELKRFDFVFYISMADVHRDQTIENCIIEQHSGLKANKVTPEEIRLLLDEDNRVLVLIDDHDRRFNSKIDEAIQKKDLWNSWMMVASRCLRHVFGNCMDDEIRIHGLDLEDSIDVNYLHESGFLSKGVEGRAARIGIAMNEYDKLFEVPAYLNMLCTILLKEVSPIQTKCTAMQAIIDRVIDREAIRETGETATEERKESLSNLGKLAWIGLADPGGPRNWFTKVILHKDKRWESRIDFFAKFKSVLRKQNSYGTYAVGLLKQYP